jgi:hypothetical protein
VTVARAKRTERAEARRRYRATLATDPLAEDADGADGVSPAGSSKDAKRSIATTGGRQGTSGTPERVGFTDAFRQSIRPVHVREDIASLPWIATHTKAIWLPVLITIAATIATAATGANDMVTGLLFTYFVVYPAVGGVLLGGFLAPRASWLVGVVIGLASAACYVALGFAGLLPHAMPGQDLSFAEVFAKDPTSTAGLAFIYSPIMGAFLAAAAAWYRRFYALSSPNRNRKQSQAPKQRPGDGRTRGGTSQKASAKR